MSEESKQPDDDARTARVVEARMRLRRRFAEKIENSPAASDSAPMGTGPKNRHGMPKLPPGQHETSRWPVLNIGSQPDVARDRWSLTIDGACAQPASLDWSQFMALDQVTDISDFHCVTTWSRFDVPWQGVRVADVLALAEPLPEATHLMAHAYDGYTTNLSLEEALKSDVLLVHTADGLPLARAHGGPCRMITPQLYAWKGAKWIHRIELMTQDRPGFWEKNGYSMTAHPWRNDRYR